MGSFWPEKKFSILTWNWSSELCFGGIIVQHTLTNHHGRGGFSVYFWWNIGLFVSLNFHWLYDRVNEKAREKLTPCIPTMFGEESMPEHLKIVGTKISNYLSALKLWVFFEKLKLTILEKMTGLHAHWLGKWLNFSFNRRAMQLPFI